MSKSYSIRTDLDKFLKSKKTNHDELIKTLFGGSKKVNTKTNVLTWLSDNPKNIELFKSWMRNNGGKPILDKISSIASGSATSKENKEDQKFYQAWANLAATDGISKELKDFKQFVTEKFHSQGKEIKDLGRQVFVQGMTIEELQREVEEKKIQVKLLTDKIQQMERKLESANADKKKLEEELSDERREKRRLLNIFREMEKKIKAAIEDNAEEALRAETERKMISETGKTSEEEINAQALKVTKLEEALNAKKAILLQLSADCKEINEMNLTDQSCSPFLEYMMASDDAANYIPPSHKV